MSLTKKINNAKINLFSQEIITRMESVQIENTDALRIISSRDSKDTFHFVDPPYIGTDLGHYKGYTENDFIRLLDGLSEIKGKFMLTMFPNEILTRYIKIFKWRYITIERVISASKEKRRKQEEVIVMNYEI